MSESWKKGDLIEGQYEIVDIKHGGMGLVFLCFDRKNIFPYAVKTFKDEYLRDKNVIERFKWEAETWVRLEKHPNIVQAYVVKNIQRRPYIFLEMVPEDKKHGSTLRGWIRTKALDFKTTLDFAVQFCRGMEHAGSKFAIMNQPFVHRDIKPENIMVTFNKVLKITDFGLVKAFGSDESSKAGIISENTNATYSFTGYGTICGTPPYMSPEQCRNDSVLDTRSDIYSFGCVLYEMLAGKPPFVWSRSEIDLAKCLKSHLEEPPVSLGKLVPAIPKDLNEAILKCLAKDPGKRFGSFTGLREALGEIYYEYTGEKLPEINNTNELNDVDLLNKGVSLSELGRNQEAIKYYDVALQRKPRFELTWFNKGNALSALNEKEAAIACYDQALQLNPRFEQACSNKGIAFYDLGRYETAIACYDQVLQINPEHEDAWTNKGNALTSLERYKEALTCFERALQLYPEDGMAWINKGTTLRILGRVEAALECHDHALQLNREWPEAWLEKGLTLLQLERLQEAIEAFTVFIKIAPPQLSSDIQQIKMMLQMLGYPLPTD